MKRNPWIGLASYDEKKIADGYAFCGRSTATHELFSQVDNNLFVTMYGKSGIGKSSLLQAGLFPKLRRNCYFPVYIRLGKDLTGTPYSETVINTICAEIKKYGCKDVPNNCISPLTTPSVKDDNYLWNFFASRRFIDGEGNNIFPVIVIDQMEELFFGNKEQLEIFFKQIYLLLDDSPLLSGAMSDKVITNYRILFSIREDDFFRLEDTIERLRLIEMRHNRYRLTELSNEEAKEIIEIPASGLLAQGEENAIATRIIETIKGENREISSAILSLLCSRIYQSTIGKGESAITLNAVELFLKDSGGNFLASFYSDIIKRLKNRSKWEYIEEFLVTEEGRRASVLRSQFDTHVPDSDFLFSGEMAILRCVTYSSGHEPHVEIIHDILAKHLKESRNERLKKRESLKKWKTAITVAAIIAVTVFVYQYWTIIRSHDRFLITQSRYLISEAGKEYDRGNITKALRISLEALNRQYISEAGIMLRKCDTPPIEGIYSQSILQHESMVQSATFSPDGKYIATTSTDSAVRIWDTKTGKPVTEPLKHEGEVRATVFSQDGKHIVTTAYDKSANIWEINTGKRIKRWKGHIGYAETSPNGKYILIKSSYQIFSDASIYDVKTGKEQLSYFNTAVFSPDGKYIVTVSNDSTATVWDAGSGKQVTEALKHKSRVRSAIFSPDGKYIITVSSDKTARVWDARTGKQVAEPLEHEGNINSAAFSPDGRYIVTVSNDSTATVWDARTGKQVAEPLEHEGNINSAAFSPHGNYIVTASWDNTARVWDVKTGKQVTEPLEHEDYVRSAAFSPDGRYIVTASGDRTARVWDVKTGKLLTEPLKQIGITPVTFSSDGRYILTASKSNNKTVIVYTNKRESAAEPLKHKSSVNSAAFSPDGRYIVTASWDNTARVWDAKSGEPVTEPLEHEDVVNSALFSPDGKYIVTTSYDNTARVWDTKSGEPVTEPLEHEDVVYSAAFSPDGRHIVTASRDKTARVWDAESGKQITAPLKHKRMVRCAVFSSDGRYIVTASDDNTARVWDAKSGEPVTEPLEHEDVVKSALFSPDGKYIVTTSYDNTARVWDANSGIPVTKPLEHKNNVNSAAFSPDGKYIVTASDDNTARVWDAKNGIPVTEPLEHEFYVKSASFSPDGRYVVTASLDNTARIMEFIPLQKIIDKYRKDPELDWSLTEEEKKEYSLE